MDSESKSVVMIVVGFIATIGLIIASVSGWEWYLAKQQRDVWEQQGIHMTTWQVLIGVKPAPALERVRR